MDANLTNKNNTMDISRLLKPDEVASFLNISRSFAYHLLQIGAIPTVHLGKACRVRLQDLEAFIEQNIHRQADKS
jgi:excisionase family DNA binding protein